MDNILTWNAPNWITVLLMALGGFALMALALKTWQNFKPAGA